VVFAFVGLGCAARWIAAEAGRRLTGAPGAACARAAVSSHVLMAAGMAAMFAPVRTPVPPAWWAAMFGAQAVALVVVALRERRGDRRQSVTAGHVLPTTAMLMMFAVLPPEALSGGGENHAGHLTAGIPALVAVGWVVAGWFLGHAVRCGLRMIDPVELLVDDRGGPVLLGARAELPLKLLMGVGMSYMLMTML
jgi:hypothetical protein